MTVAQKYFASPYSDRWLCAGKMFGENYKHNDVNFNTTSASFWASEKFEDMKIML
jgi:hypothetical protein